MPQDLRATPEALIETYGGMRNIPENVLATHGYACIHREESNDIIIVDSDWPGKAKGISVRLLRDYRGYIYANHVRRLLGTINGTDLVMPKDLTAVETRAKAFIEAGIPPIFDHRFGDRNFPLIDYLVQYSTGAYHRRVAAKAIAKAAPEVNPATINDVREFRSVAFLADGTLEPPLIREIILATGNNFRFQNHVTRTHVLSQIEEALRFLEATLRDLPHEPRRYFKVPPGSEEVLVAKRRWYLTVRPDKRQAVVRAFLDLLSREETKQRLRILRDRLEPVFPEWCEEQSNARRTERRQAEKIDEHDARLNAAIAAQDFRDLPHECFFREPWKTPLRLALEAYAEELVATIDDETFRKLACLHRTTLWQLLPISRAPCAMGYLPESFVQILFRYREDRVRSMSDDEFLACYPRETRNSITSIIGATKAPHRNRADELAFWEWVRDRLNCLRPY